MTDAFARLGHEVRHIGKPMGRAIWGMELPARYEWTPDEVDYDVDVSDPYQIPEHHFDLIIVMDSDPAMLDLLNDMPFYRYQSPVVVYGVDNHVRSYRRPRFDRYFLAHHDGHVQPVRQPDESWLPCAYDNIAFTPSEIPYAEREYDVCMLGVMYNHRRALVNELRAAGLKVFAGTGLVYDQYADAYHNARLSLCASLNGDVAQRVYETAALGCMVISDECDDFQRLRPRGLHIAPERFLVERVKMFVNDPKHAQACIAESLEWVKPHTWQARAQKIVDWFEAEKAGEIASESV